MALNADTKAHAEAIYTALIVSRGGPGAPQPSELARLAQTAINCAKIFSQAAKEAPRG